MLEKGHRLRWVQDRSPLDNYKFPELMESDVVVTSMRGIWSDYIADHAMTFVLMFARGFHLYVRSQLKREWREPAPVVHLENSTLGIIGLGGIGTEVAKRGATFGMRVLAVDLVKKEKPEFVALLWDVEQLGDLLAASDFVVNCVPHTDHSVNLIGAEQLRQMRKTAYLINVTRGVVVDLDALISALEKGEIAGAGLDAFAIEPLPSVHPLWTMENVLITPHKAWVSGSRKEARRINVLKENLRRFIAGEPLINVATSEAWF